MMEVDEDDHSQSKQEDGGGGIVKYHFMCLDPIYSGHTCVCVMTVCKVNDQMK